MALWLRTHTAFPGDLSQVLSNYVRYLTKTYQPQLQGDITTLTSANTCTYVHILPTPHMIKN